MRPLAILELTLIGRQSSIEPWLRSARSSLPGSPLPPCLGRAFHPRRRLHVSAVKSLPCSRSSTAPTSQVPLLRSLSHSILCLHFLPMHMNFVVAPCAVFLCLYAVCQVVHALCGNIQTGTQIPALFFSCFGIMCVSFWMCGPSRTISIHVLPLWALLLQVVRLLFRTAGSFLSFTHDGRCRVLGRKLPISIDPGAICRRL